MNYIDKLHSIRLLKNMSVRQLYLNCELSESSVKRILAKECSPTIDSLEKICAVLDLSLEQLFTYTNEQTFKKSERDIALLDACRSMSDEAIDALLAFIKTLKF